MPERLFRDRRDAGAALALLLDRYRGRPDVIVLGLPRGGVPVAYEVATALGVPLDAFVVRKLGVPGREEVAMGAASDDWGGPAERKWVRPALTDSVEELFHDVGQKGFLVSFGAAPGSSEALRSARLERAIGVIYRPDTERQSHYFRARLADQFDAVIHIDETRAVEPLERTAGWERGEVPETYPFAL